MGLLRLLGIEKYLKKVKDYVDEKVEGMPQGSTSLTSILNRELPLINIDVNGWSNNSFTFAQLGITDEYIDRWIVLSSINTLAPMICRIHPLNIDGFYDTNSEVRDGCIIFYYEGDEGDANIEVDIWRKCVHINNNWE